MGGRVGAGLSRADFGAAVCHWGAGAAHIFDQAQHVIAVKGIAAVFPKAFDRLSQFIGLVKSYAVKRLQSPSGDCRGARTLQDVPGQAGSHRRRGNAGFWMAQWPG